MELLKSMAQIDLVHVPYKGGAPATTATVAGEVAAMMSGTSTAAQIRAGMQQWCSWFEAEVRAKPENWLFWLDKRWTRFLRETPRTPEAAAAA